MQIDKENIKKILIFSFAFILITASYSVCSQKIKDSSKIQEEIINQKWAVIVEVPGWAILNLDANQIYKTLIKNGWKEENIKLLLENEVNRENIIQSLNWLSENEGKNDVVLFYYAGFGTYKKDETPLDERDGYDEYIWSDRNNKIRDDELGEIFDRFDSNKIVAIFNSCYSGGMFDGRIDLGKKGRVILSSCKANEEFFWFQKGKSTFGLMLSLGINGRADKNKNNTISVEEAFSYASPKTTFFNFFLQHPQLYDGYEGELQIFN